MEVKALTRRKEEEWILVHSLRGLESIMEQEAWGRGGDAAMDMAARD